MSTFRDSRGGGNVEDISDGDLDERRGGGRHGPRGQLTATLADERLGGGMDGPLLRHDHLPTPASPRAGGGAREDLYSGI